MQFGLDNNQDDVKDFQQRMAGQNIRSIEDRQDEIQHAKNGFIGMLAGIVVGGVVGWLFLGPTGGAVKEKEIPVIRRPLTPAKVQPNDPGGMEIENQNREIYHIVDNLPKNNKEVNIIPAPEMPKIIVENNISTPDNIENLVESIEENGNVDSSVAEIPDDEGKVKVANSDLSGIKTNSREKVIIPEKIKSIDVKLQKSINSEVKKQETPTTKEQSTTKEQATVKEQPAKPVSTTASAQSLPKSAKGTWYAQIIASSSRQAVENLWRQLSTKHTFLKTYIHEIEEITVANGGKLYRLKVGAFKTRPEAEKLSERLKQNQISSIIKQN